MTGTILCSFHSTSYTHYWIKLTTYNIKQVYKMSISKLVRKDMEVNEDERLLSKFRHILK
jgi:hypothetical protein